jgi:hypothetical protein
MACNPPFPVVALLKDKELLIGFSGGFAAGMMVGRADRVCTNMGPRWLHHHQLRNGELHVKFQLVEDFAYAFLTPSLLTAD